MAKETTINTTETLAKGVDAEYSETFAALSGQKRVRVRIPLLRNGTAETAVQVWLNGVPYTIPRNESVELPVDVVALLRNAEII